MLARYSFSLVLLVALLIAGCATDKEFQRIDALARDPAWPKIRAAAEIEIARREGATAWSYQAFYQPQQHTNGVWVVLATGAYPGGQMGDFIDVLVRDGGEIVSASPRRPARHPKWK